MSSEPEPSLSEYTEVPLEDWVMTDGDRRELEIQIRMFREGSRAVREEVEWLEKQTFRSGSTTRAKSSTRGRFQKRSARGTTRESSTSRSPRCNSVRSHGIKGTAAPRMAPPGSLDRDGAKRADRDGLGVVGERLVMGRPVEADEAEHVAVL